MAAQSDRRAPLYQQIRDYIRSQIQNNNWKPGDRIPSESELSRQFDVSRITIRGAVSKLIEEGFITRIQGKGTFITHSTGSPHSFEHPDTDSRPKLIGYLMPRLDNRFTANLLNGLETEIAKHGYRLLFCKTDDSEEIETERLREMLDLGVEGIIVYPVAGEHYNEEILKLTLNRFPLVVVDRYLRGIESNCVCADNFEGARQAVSHLIKLGHQKIGFISSNIQPTTSMEDRWRGYESALRDYGIPADKNRQLLHMDMTRVNSILKDGKGDEESLNLLIAFLNANPDLTALVAANTAIGLNVMEASKTLDISIPDDLSIVFFDDYEASPFSAVPPTCISQQEYLLGVEAAKLLTSILQNPHRERQKIVTPVKLIVRNSTGPCKNRI